MYAIEKDVPYQQTISKCKYPELRKLANEMEIGDSVVVDTIKECTALQMYIDRRLQQMFGINYPWNDQITRRKRVADEMGETIGYRVWRLK